MKISENTSLLPYNTFGINVDARYFIDVNSHEDLQEYIRSDQFSNLPTLVLGGGSNVLFTKDYDGIVLKNNILGIEASENDDEVLLRVGAGENWHEFVMFCVKNGFGGIENLSLIPGNVGASPMQNIGAYGVEVKDVVTSVEFTDLKSGDKEILKAEDCEFGYRTSVFKTNLRNKKFISHVNFRLSKNSKFNTSYGAIEKELDRLELDASIANVSKAVINIRQSKLPDPKVIGNAGSFFKNPVVDEKLADELSVNYENMPRYSAGGDKVKLAAGWLIEKAGWKGKRIDNYGVHVNQALVLVNYGGASGSDINDLAEEIRSDIHSRFGIELEKEVNII